MNSTSPGLHRIHYRLVSDAGRAALYGQCKSFLSCRRPEQPQAGSTDRHVLPPDLDPCAPAVGAREPATRVRGTQNPRGWVRPEAEFHRSDMPEAGAKAPGISVHAPWMEATDGGKKKLPTGKVRGGPCFQVTPGTRTRVLCPGRPGRQNSRLTGREENVGKQKVKSRVSNGKSLRQNCDGRVGAQLRNSVHSGSNRSLLSRVLRSRPSEEPNPFSSQTRPVPGSRVVVTVENHGDAAAEETAADSRNQRGFPVSRAGGTVRGEERNTPVACAL